MEVRKSKLKFVLGAGCALAVLACAANASAEERTFNVASARAADTIPEFARQAGIQIVAPADRLQGVKTPAIEGSYDTRQALAMLIAGTGLHVASDDGRTVMLSADPQSGSAAGDGADAGTVAALVVTAQKKEENIQDVPIAISAFTEKSLQEQKIEGGFDLLKAIPNVTFSKNNFTSYNFSIRGIGTKAVSATTDPGVAVSFNNASLIQNRLFEQEYFDVERVEVLRGPQGTLYGRNATAGVINVISAKPNLTEFSGWLKGEVGNYHAKRISAMVNVPLVEGKLALRLAGSLTKRSGYDFNSVTNDPVNGRDLWSGRLTLGFNPNDRVRSNLIWEHFNEDDDRSRTGKQLCHHDSGPAAVGTFDTTTPDYYSGHDVSIRRRALFSQGCKPGSMYNDSAFGTPNGFALPFVFHTFGGYIAGLTDLDGDGERTDFVYRLKFQDPYGGMMQSRDLRTIASFRNPVYRAKADVTQLNADVDLSDHLTFTSQTAYDKDEVYSFQDYNRFNTLPIFTDTSDPSITLWPSSVSNFAPGGVFCDPQLGCSNTMAGFDISKARSTQFSQEFRVQSDFDGKWNFSVGANYTRFKVLADYYVFYNLITLTALSDPFNWDETYTNAAPDFTLCRNRINDFSLSGPPVPITDPLGSCPYIDPNPVESINGEGHNYFRSKNPYRLTSAAAFGEVYWKVTPDLKLTLGLRYNDDKKTFIPVPSQVLTSISLVGGGTVNKGYPEKPAIKQRWGEWTGRLGFDWKPDLALTDETMIYAFYSRGYKGGGANPPGVGFATADESLAIYRAAGFSESDLNFLAMIFPILKPPAAEYGPTFRPEFVNAYEAGAKNTLLGGALTLNGDAFFYDYHDYQVSQVRDRTAVNENFDAKVWGLELETMFAPTPNLQLVGNVGFLDTRIANGMKSIDVMNRTQGRSDWLVAKPWVQYPSNCVVPTAVAQRYLENVTPGTTAGYWNLCGRVGGLLSFFPPIIDPATNQPYDVSNYPEANGGAGFYADLSGNELPNSPHWTVNLGARYSIDVSDHWRATVRADGYWQSQSWARVYNAVNDKLHGWYNANLSLWVENEDGLKFELYAKNILDKTPITDAFINSDDTALTTNVFVLDPRLIGLSIKKGF